MFARYLNCSPVYTNDCIYSTERLRSQRLSWVIFISMALFRMGWQSSRGFQFFLSVLKEEQEKKKKTQQEDPANLMLPSWAALSLYNDTKRCCYSLVEVQCFRPLLSNNALCVCEYVWSNCWELLHLILFFYSATNQVWIWGMQRAARTWPLKWQKDCCGPFIISWVLECTQSSLAGCCQ